MVCLLMVLFLVCNEFLLSKELDSTTTVMVASPMMRGKRALRLSNHNYQFSAGRHLMVFHVNTTGTVRVDLCEIDKCHANEKSFAALQIYICVTSTKNQWCPQWEWVIANTGQDWGYNARHSLKGRLSVVRIKPRPELSN